MVDPDAALARRLWQVLEPYHAVTYLAEEALAAFAAIGLRGFWRGYFAGRAAPLGAVGAGTVVGAFYGFHPEFVRRAMPSVWSMATPTQAIDARLAGVDAALRRVLGDAVESAAVRDAVALARVATDGCQPFGRPMYAANADLTWPSAPHLALWHAATLLREHRGDGHVAALVGAQVGPCDAHVLRLAISGLGRETIQPYRGWTDDDWAAAGARLAGRGWLGDSGAPTPDGRAAHREIELVTDRLAAGPINALGRDRCNGFIDAMRPLTDALDAAAVIPYPNPMGVPRPST